MKLENINWFTSTYGCAEKIENKLKKKLGINLTLYTQTKFEKDNFFFKNKLKNRFLKGQKILKKINGEECINQKNTNINFYKDINSYRGIRQKYHLPVRGQRTHTNRHTAKQLNKIHKTT